MTSHLDRGVETSAFRPERKRRFTSPEMSVPDGIFGIVRESQAGTCITQHETAAGHAVAARGGVGVAPSVNREPTARRESRLESPAFGRVEDVKALLSFWNLGQD